MATTKKNVKLRDQKAAKDPRGGGGKHHLAQGGHHAAQGGHGHHQAQGGGGKNAR